MTFEGVPGLVETGEDHGETTLVIGGTFAASGDLNLLLVILAGAAGAIVGDNISYGIGNWVGEKTVKRWFRSEKSAKRLRHLRKPAIVKPADARTLRRLLPYG